MTATITTTPGAVQLHPTAQKLRQIVAELNSQFVEREELFEAMLLGLLGNLHVFILGEPGTAKSMSVRAFFARIQMARYFEKQMAGDTPWESLAGAIDLVKLTNEGKFTRKTKGTYVECHFAMIDEVGRTSGVVADNMLTIMNERLYHEVDDVTGQSVHKVPLRLMMGGSNSLPTEENESFAAFFDRMPIRCIVRDIQEDANFIQVLSTGARPVPNPTTITLDEIIEAADVIIPDIPLPRDVLVAVAKLRADLRDKQVYPSPRRWVQSMNLVRASAFLAGRTEATTEDLAVLRFILWDVPQERDEVERLTTSVSNPMGDKLNVLSDRFDEIERERRALISNTGMATDKKTAEATQQAANCNVLLTDLDQALQEARRNGYSTQKLEKLVADTQAAKQAVLDAMVAALSGN